MSFRQFSWLLIRVFAGALVASSEHTGETAGASTQGARGTERRSDSLGLSLTCCIDSASDCGGALGCWTWEESALGLPLYWPPWDRRWWRNYRSCRPAMVGAVRPAVERPCLLAASRSPRPRRQSDWQSHCRLNDLMWTQEFRLGSRRAIWVYPAISRHPGFQTRSQSLERELMMRKVLLAELRNREGILGKFERIDHGDDEYGQRVD